MLTACLAGTPASSPDEVAGRCLWLINGIATLGEAMLHLEANTLHSSRAQHAPATIREMVTYSRDSSDPQEVNISTPSRAVSVDELKHYTRGTRRLCCGEIRR